jgi:hypothetical protein
VAVDKQLHWMITVRIHRRRFLQARRCRLAVEWTVPLAHVFCRTAHRRTAAHAFMCACMMTPTGQTKPYLLLEMYPMDAPVVPFLMLWSWAIGGSQAPAGVKRRRTGQRGCGYRLLLVRIQCLFSFAQTAKAWTVEPWRMLDNSRGCPPVPNSLLTGRALSLIATAGHHWWHQLV